MSDETEMARRRRLAEINLVPGSKEALEQQYGEVWDTDQMSELFRPVGFMAPYLVVVRIADNQKGSLEFQHDPRFYFNFKPHK